MIVLSVIFHYALLLVSGDPFSVVLLPASTTTTTVPVVTIVPDLPSVFERDWSFAADMDPQSLLVSLCQILVLSLSLNIFSLKTYSTLKDVEFPPPTELSPLFAVDFEVNKAEPSVSCFDSHSRVHTGRETIV